MESYYVKVCFSYWTNKEIPVHSSINELFRVQYIPGEWTYSAFEGSKLMFFESLLAARLFYPEPKYANPYMGLSFWYCEADGISKHLPVKSGTRWDIWKYWKNINMKVWERTNLPWHLKFRNDVVGVLFADRIMITHLVMPEDFELFKNAVPIDK